MQNDLKLELLIGLVGSDGKPVYSFADVCRMATYLAEAQHPIANDDIVVFAESAQLVTIQPGKVAA